MGLSFLCPCGCNLEINTEIPCACGMYKLNTVIVDGKNVTSVIPV